MDRIEFKINGQPYSVGNELNSNETLLDFLRERTELRGTKYMCREAGCGACVVAACKQDGKTFSVNSCMVSVTSCQDWEITTVEKVGNKLQGYHPVQTTLAKYNGTQCGYCSPGWVMAMYSLMKNKKSLSMLEIEKSFGSNICRCTGYRPILDAFKTFANDSPNKCDVLDIEETDLCKKSCDDKKCDLKDWCLLSTNDVNILKIDLKDGKKWYRVCHVDDVFHILSTEGSDSYMLVSGNTAKGAYPIAEYPRILIDISEVEELKGNFVDQNLVIGAGNTLTEILGIFLEVSKQEYFEYLQKLYDHILLVAHIPVRNIGTVAGNLMIKHQHNEFPSDIFLLLETVGAQVTIISNNLQKETVTMQEFLNINMKGKVILNIMLPPLTSEYRLVTFKIMPRSQNAHAIVNAGFLYNLDHKNNVVESRIVFGGLSSSFVRASVTEHSLIGKSLFTNDTLQFAVKCLDIELHVEENPPEPSVLYRKQLAINLFYKGLLTIYPSEKLDPLYRSGVRRIRESRGVSEGRQFYDTNQSIWPLNQPVQKLEALIQCSGEAAYTEDIPYIPGEVFASFVLSTVPTGKITSTDPSIALSLSGVIAFYTAKDIPGLNSFLPIDGKQYIADEEILSSGEIRHYNQPIGIIVAESRELAERAATLVKVTYSNVRPPLIDIKQAKKRPTRNTLYYTSKAKQQGTDIVKVINGECTLKGQYHFTMETLTCVTKPTEEGLEVYATTQWMDAIQLMTSRALNMDQNRIDVKVLRLGGGFGFKISRIVQVAVACNLVALKLNKPCRFIQALTTNMRAIGKRLPSSADFKISVNKSGLIQSMNYSLYEDNGHRLTEVLSSLGIKVFSNCYDNSRWNFKCFNTVTDTPKNTWMRSPSTLEHIAVVETFMDQIAYALSIDPLEVRLANIDNLYRKDINELITSLKQKSQYSERRMKVDKFNEYNRWKKRGLRFSMMRWDYSESPKYNVLMSVYHGDGTVAITFGGIEMGQGINTKAVQICAYLLNIPINKIKIKGRDTLTASNNDLSGGSFTTQFVSIGVIKCCTELLKRLEPIEEQLDNPSWEQVIKAAFEAQIDLQVHSYVNQDDLIKYNIFGVNLSEVEVDILTGEMQVRRVDLLQDVGRSVNPEIDVGQIEGAFVMGLGYWTTEDLVYDKNGQLLTNRTWNYYVPQARDIPQDLRIYFRKKSYSNDAELGAKATGEPSICMAVSVPLAIREALMSARADSGLPRTKWFQIDGPFTAEKICLAAETRHDELKFY